MIRSIRELVKAHTRVGLREALWHLWFELQIEGCHGASVRRAKKLSLATPLKLNLGCGSNPKEGWINIDLSGKADLRLDLRENLPFQDESASIVYSEHFFEHLEYPAEACGLLKESWRVLTPGGIFSVGIPDFLLSVTSYLTGEGEYFQRVPGHMHPEWCDTRMHHLNYDFRQRREHKYAYDFETLAKVLATAGFVSIVKRPFSPELDSATREWGTLYMEARKPQSWK